VAPILVEIVAVQLTFMEKVPQSIPGLGLDLLERLTPVVRNCCEKIRTAFSMGLSSSVPGCNVVAFSSAVNQSANQRRAAAAIALTVVI